MLEISHITPELADLLRDHWWYHRMDLGGDQVTPGRYGDNLIPVLYLAEARGS